ncbi:MAG TPA: LysR substrate-binding domain-containing protein [Polyangiaceae bacterium]|nr:LysR substrate-binding domain-containing protein [Polyangiaceae bacterium]
MDLSQVTLTQMRYAVEIEQSGSFRLAASAAHVSQSGLSMQIQKLEDLLGTVLFDRSKKPVLLTPAGAAALAQMRTILRETERLGQIVVDGGEPGGRYRLGVIPTLSPTVIPLFLGPFSRAYPRVELVVEELRTAEIITRLRADTLDAGLLSTPLGVPGISEKVLGLEGMVAYLPPGDPLASHHEIAQSELADRALWVMPEGHCFRSQVLSYCRPRKPEGATGIRFESGSFQTLVKLVDDGLGATVLPDLVVRELAASRRKAQVRPLVSPAPVREIGLVTARSDLRRSVTDVLEASIRAALAEVLTPTPKRARRLDPMSVE